jgi:two-component system CheB/CheR fusion protein
VGIGASAGGIEAFKGFFENMPPDSGMAFVVILHLPADRKSLLPEILGRWTRMPVVEAKDGCPVEPNTIYLPPSGIVVTLHNGRLYPHRTNLDGPRELTPIDMFFNSLATEMKEEAIGVVLSGSGSDGTLGLKAIKTCGGLTLAQGADGTGPQHAQMPASAIAAGTVDIVAPVEAIPANIVRVTATRRDAAASSSLSREHIDETRLAICGIVQRQIGHDFSGYKEKTFLRRVERRMQVRGIPTLTGYAALLQAESEEVTNLFRDLLISVTSFFRDTETFDALKQRAMAHLFRTKNADSRCVSGWQVARPEKRPIRWLCCCASMPTG